MNSYSCGLGGNCPFRGGEVKELPQKIQLVTGGQRGSNSGSWGVFCVVCTVSLPQWEGALCGSPWTAKPSPGPWKLAPICWRAGGQAQRECPHGGPRFQVLWPCPPRDPPRALTSRADLPSSPSRCWCLLGHLSGRWEGTAGCEPRDVKPAPGDLQTCSKPWALRCLQHWWGAVCGMSWSRVTRPYGWAQMAGSPLSPPEVWKPEIQVPQGWYLLSPL